MEIIVEIIVRIWVIIEEILGYKNLNFKVMVVLYFFYSCSRDLLEESLDMVKELNIFIYIYVVEIKEEFGIILKWYGKCFFVFLEELGYLDYLFVFVYGVELNEWEIECLVFF